MTTPAHHNAQPAPPARTASALLEGLQFLADIIRARVTQLLNPAQPVDLPVFHFHRDDTPLAAFVVENELTIEEYLLLLLAIAPHVHPNFLGSLIAEQLPVGAELPELGGYKTNQVRAILPTGETALFVLAGMDLSERLRCSELLSAHRRLFRQKVLALDLPGFGEPLHSGKLGIFRDWLERFTLGRVTLPELSLHFPAQHIVTDLEWDDLVLNEYAMAQLQEIKIWVEHNETLLRDWDMAARLKPGYRALFYGPPGTGKTLAAMLLGKYTGREVFRIDLATTVSKYIGETEKNLANLFDQAEHKDWILFFDEADAIFGKRTQVRDAHDKYANQEVSYLLQRMESFPGVVILASNFRANLDDAFVRRFQSLIYFPLPKAAERLAIWQKSFPSAVQLDPSARLDQIAEKYELSGSNIVNIVHYCCLLALSKNTSVISAQNLQSGISRELVKENKAV